MSQQTKPNNRVDFQTAHQELVRAMRPYSAASIVETALRVLRRPTAKPIDRLRDAPWQILLLVKWALVDPQVQLFQAPPIPQSDFDMLRQRLWSIWGWADVQHATGHLFMRQLLNAQIDFQRAPTFSFMRQSALIARLRKGHVLRQKFNELFGMEPETYLDLAFVAHASVLNGRETLSKEWFSPLEPYYGGAVITSFLRLLSRDLPGLREELLRPPGELARPTELFEFPVLKQFPLLLRPDGHYECWHPMVFSRGLEDFVHRRFATLGPLYTEKYSEIFESYVVELLGESGQPYLDEHALKGRVGAGASVPEAAVCLAGCNLFVEAKMGLFPDALFVEGTPEHLRNRLKAVRKAIKQGWNISSSLRGWQDRNDPSLPSGQDFLIVVTNRDLNLSRGDLLASMSPESDGSPYPFAEAERFLPLSNVLFSSIDDFELLVGMVRTGAIELAGFLRGVVAANADPSTSAYYLGDHLKRVGGAAPQSALMEQAVAASLQRLSRIGE